MERVEVIRAGIGMCQVIRQNQIFHKSFLAKGASLSFVLAEYWREQKEIGPKYVCILYSQSCRFDFRF